MIPAGMFRNMGRGAASAAWASNTGRGAAIGAGVGATGGLLSNDGNMIGGGFKGAMLGAGVGRYGGAAFGNAARSIARMGRGSAARITRGQQSNLTTGSLMNRASRAFMAGGVAQARSDAKFGYGKMNSGYQRVASSFRGWTGGMGGGV